MLRLIRFTLLTAAIWPCLTAARCAENSANVERRLVDTESERAGFMKAEQAVASISLPEGFQATVFAAEPTIRQPIAMATDARGRLWVAENFSYSDASENFDDQAKDRIVILEDGDGDGRAEKRTVFWDGANKLTSIEIGHGGVWALCAPHLLFLPDRNGDDAPDGDPVVVLDGWNDDEVRHTIVNGLRWGPDGWLYGRHGILHTSRVGAPGTPVEQRTPINCGIWRYHPVRKAFEAVAHGTTNPWGMDWDANGQLFFVNTVIGHLWHVLPGAHYERMFGDDLNPYAYELLPQTADHVHWNTAEKWADVHELGVTAETDHAGGGHAHSGLMIYLGDQWPEEYRHDAYMLNFHGRRMNRDRLARRGAGYVATHQPDAVAFGDPWFRGIDLLYGQDGGVYVADWSDTGECHDNDGIHRNSGRIYKITYGVPGPARSEDLDALANADLASLQSAKNEWLARKSRQLLYERALAGDDVNDAETSLRRQYEESDDTALRLRAMWCLHLLGKADAHWLVKQLQADDEHIRTWAVRLLGEADALGRSDVRSALTAQANSDDSGLVLVTMASALQRMPIADRWSLAESLASRGDFASDPTLPLMTWYGIEPAVPADPARAVKLVQHTALPTLRRLITRRLAEELEAFPEPLAALADALSSPRESEWIRDVLEGVAGATRGRRRLAPPDGWTAALTQLAHSPESDERTRALAQELLVVFGDGHAIEHLREIAVSTSASVDQRRNAIESLVASRADGLPPILYGLLQDRQLAGDALRALAALGDSRTPEEVIPRFSGFDAPLRDQAVSALASRPEFARALLSAIAAGQVPQEAVPPFQIRQLWSFEDEEIRLELERLWPQTGRPSQDKAHQIAELRELLTVDNLAAADRSQGRAVFDRTCAACHRLFGEGQTLGPELTGSQRHNVAYLLENIVDPSLQVAEQYRTSIVMLDDGRILNGLLTDRDKPVVTLQTQTETLRIPRESIEEIEQTEQSIMPERLLDSLQSQQICDLVAYLTSPQQAPLPPDSATQKVGGN